MFPSKEQARLYALFGYETDRGRQSVLWQNPWYFTHPSGQSGRMLDEDFANWGSTKRAFTKEELLVGTWLKIGDHGYSFSMTFLSNDTLEETNLFDPYSRQLGTWTLMGQVLRTTVLDYELDIFANKIGSIHSGVEYVKGNAHPHAYFKLIHLLQ